MSECTCAYLNIMQTVTANYIQQCAHLTRLLLLALQLYNVPSKVDLYFYASYRALCVIAQAASPIAHCTGVAQLVTLPALSHNQRSNTVR
jgi:hypothetical protein